MDPHISNSLRLGDVDPTIRMPPEPSQSFEIPPAISEYSESFAQLSVSGRQPCNTSARDQRSQNPKKWSDNDVNPKPQTPNKNGVTMMPTLMFMDLAPFSTGPEP